MAYLGVFMGYCSKLRNSLSRREFFREGDDYYRAFDLRGDEGEGTLGPLPDAFVPGEKANVRALQILGARSLEEVCRAEVAAIEDKTERGSLRKGAYYLAHVVYLREQVAIDKLIAEAAPKERRPAVAQGFVEAVGGVAKGAFDDAKKIFKKTLAKYMKAEGANEDAALKNSSFAERVDNAARPN